MCLVYLWHVLRFTICIVDITLYRLTAPFFSLPLSHLINLSFLSHFIPPQWKVAIIRPKAKTNSPSQNADFRLISILPVLSRVVEKQIVQRFIYPTLTQPPLESLVSDQFASDFRPTGSTSAAIISIIHHTQCFTLDIPNQTYNWLVEHHLERSVYLTIIYAKDTLHLFSQSMLV